jgi:hypothetical protein
MNREQELEAALLKLRFALSWTLTYREFSDEWHNPRNEDVLAFRKLREAALKESGEVVPLRKSPSPVITDFLERVFGHESRSV